MIVNRGRSTNQLQPATSPHPLKTGVFFELRGGDFLHPLGRGKNADGTSRWFNLPGFKKAVRFYCPWRILPFLSWRVGKHGGYIGAKIYGVDSPAYKKTLPVEEGEVFDGSLAMQLSIRPYARLVK